MDSRNSTGKLTIYDIDAEQARINLLLEENGGELTPEIEKALTINHVNFLTKAEGYAAAIDKYRDMAKLCKEKRDELTNKQRVCENIVKCLEGRLAWAMHNMGYDEVQIGLRKASFRKSQAVSIDDQAKIPAVYIKVETSVDKAALRAALKGGENIEGAHLVTNETLHIK